MLTRVMMVDGDDTQKGMGRIRHYDPKNEGFRIRNVMSVRAATAVARTDLKLHYDSNWAGDQGTEGACTAFALAHYRDAGPVRQKGGKKLPPHDPWKLYSLIQAQDRAESRHFSEGATSLAMAKVAQKLGWIGEYRWGYTLEELIAGALLDTVCLGINWYRGMSWPRYDKKARKWFAEVSGSLDGGHEILVTGVDLEREWFRLKNSWGPAYANNGRVILTFKAAKRLIEQEDGDVGLFRELPPALLRRLAR
jgi:hypothetical protein